MSNQQKPTRRIMSIEEIFPEKQLEQLNVFKERNSEYGNSYEKVGEILQILFPKGITIKDKDSHQFFDLFKQALIKLVRFCYNNQFVIENFQKDSLIDAVNYLNILLSLYEQKIQIKNFLKLIHEESRNEIYQEVKNEINNETENNTNL